MNPVYDFKGRVALVTWTEVKDQFHVFAPDRSAAS